MTPATRSIRLSVASLFVVLSLPLIVYRSVSALPDVLHRLSAEVYRTAAAQPEAAPGNGSTTEDETRTDAEYEVIDVDAPTAT